jgi:foldase protein PrsA
VLLLALIAAPALAGCGLKERLRDFLQGGPDEGAAVRVGDTIFTRAELDRFFDSRLSEFREPSSADGVKSSLLESFVEEKMLLHEAKRHGVKADPGMVKSMMEEIAGPGAEEKETADELRRTVEESLSMQRYLEDHLLKGVAVTEQECEEYYNRHLSDYVSGDVIHVREILVDDQALAERILLSLKANRNRNFGELARLHSKAATSADGGDMGRFERGELPGEFERVVFRLQPGNVSKIVRTRYGYHMFMVEERIRAHQQKFYEVREQIHDKLVSDRETEIMRKELSELPKRIPVEIFRDNLGFKYVGSKLAPGGETN